MKTRRRYGAVSEAIFLAKERGQLQPLTSVKPSGSPCSANSITGPASPSSFRKARPPLETEGAAITTKYAPSTVGRRPRTSPAREGSSSELVTCPHTATTTKNFGTSVSRGVWIGTYLGVTIRSLDKHGAHTPFTWRRYALPQ